MFAGFGARVVRSLFFWGLAAVLASSAYTGIVRIAKERPRPEDAGTTEAGGVNARSVAAVLAPAQTDPTRQAAQTDSAREAAQTDPTQQAAQTDPARQAAQTDPTQQAAQADSAQQETQPDDPTERRRVALTFDDGPHPSYTEELLDGLKERGVRATFFVIGENIPGNEDVIRRMDEEGHLIGNHTYNHVKISDMSKEDACEQIEKTSALIRELTGKDTEFVRPPFGEWNKELECSFVMIPVLWDVDPKDWTTNNVSDIVRRVLEDTKNGDIILLHDYYRSSVQAALQIVDELQEQGYEFVTVEELILE